LLFNITSDCWQQQKKRFEANADRKKEPEARTAHKQTSKDYEVNAIHAHHAHYGLSIQRY